MQLSPALLLALLLPIATFGLEPQPVPKWQALPLPRGEVSFQRDGVELTRLYTSAEFKRPFLYPVLGPAGRSLTRMGHPHDPESHRHHNSVWIAHQLVAGQNFWEDRGATRIAHQRFLRFEDGPSGASVETENAWLGASGEHLLREYRRITVSELSHREYLLILDLQLQAPAAQPVELGATAFGLVGVRMAKTIGVADGGGTIRNSEGGANEAGCFRKAARWVDYAGPIAPARVEGITLLDHPQNPPHPTPFHVRDDGWMCASTTFGGSITLAPGGPPLRLRYGLYIHAGAPSPEQLEAQWRTFAATLFREFAVKK